MSSKLWKSFRRERQDQLQDENQTASPRPVNRRNQATRRRRTRPSARPSLTSSTSRAPFPSARVAAQIKATGRDINNRAVSFSLQGMKKRGLVKKARMASGRCRRRAVGALPHDGAPNGVWPAPSCPRLSVERRAREP
ncbi:winged-helix domain-containing protein [Methylocapsa aurea]|uniref:winged-helix domain-containing protein n=1 Tax=Methylocapsa aurea TaxID=663610 RepID=UPI00138E273F